MSKCLSAYTKLDQIYPGYINYTQESNGTISIYVRGDPKVVDGAYLCGFPKDKGQHGRCTPRDDNCNNYCNMAPNKGPMQDHPKPCKQVICGETVKLSLSQKEFDVFQARLQVSA